MRKIIAINGQFTARRQTGQERFAVEIVRALDKIAEKGKYELIVPSNATHVPELENVIVRKFGCIKDPLWEQTFFFLYVLLKRRLSLNLCTIMPILKPGPICVHDIAFKTNVLPHVRKTLYKKVSRIWHLLQYNLAFLFSPVVFTVSNYSKRQMIDVYKVNPNKIVVIGNGWEHFERVQEDETFIKNYPELFKTPYFFSLASLTPNKNFKWVLNVAQQHPEYTFLIGGQANVLAYGTDFQDKTFPNVRFLGYISDGEVKCLMRHCKAFLFPSIFEGFGIPPLEALSVGAKIVVSKTSCLPEIFGNSAYYIDPYNPQVNLDELLSQPVASPENVLKTYRFSRFAKILDKQMDEILLKKSGN